MKDPPVIWKRARVDYKAFDDGALHGALRRAVGAGPEPTRRPVSLA